MQLPAADFERRFGAAQTFAEQQLIAAVDVVGIQDRRAWVQRLQVRTQRLAVVHPVGLAQQQAIRRRHLGQPFRVQAFLQGRVAGVDQGDDQADMKTPAQLHGRC